MSPLFANAGLPMIGKVWPAAWALLAPVVFVEALLAVRILRAGSSKGLLVSLVGNLASTIVGIPMCWFLLLLIMAAAPTPNIDFNTPGGRLLTATLGSPILVVGVDIDERHLAWMIPAAGATLCLPFFLASVGIEGLVACLFVTRENRNTAWRWAFVANLATYVPIALGLIVLSIRAARFGFG